MSYYLYNCVLLLVQLCLTACGNGCQTVLQLIGLCWGLCWSSSQANSPHRLWKWLAGKQSSPFIGLFVQLCLTVCATLSYCLWKWLANSPLIDKTVLGTVLKQFSGKQPSPFMEMVGWQAVLPIYRTVCATVSYCLCNSVLLLVQLCLTACENGWQTVL